MKEQLVTGCTEELQNLQTGADFSEIQSLHLKEFELSKKKKKKYKKKIHYKILFKKVKQI